MKLSYALVLAIALAGCASYDGRGLVPGRSTAAEVEALMGPAAYRRPGAGGETVHYYSRQPFGRQIFAARIGPDGKLIAIEQTLTEENIAKLVPSTTRREQVRDLLGPPYRITQLPRTEREVWEYKMYGVPDLKVLFIQFSPDGIAREVYYMLDPELRRPVAAL